MSLLTDYHTALNNLDARLDPGDVKNVQNLAHAIAQDTAATTQDPPLEHLTSQYQHAGQKLEQTQPSQWRNWWQLRHNILAHDIALYLLNQAHLQS